MSALKSILDSKQKWLKAQKAQLPMPMLEHKLARTSYTKRPFAQTICDRSKAQKNTLIAEIKRASPSKGALGKKPDDLLRDYVKSQATCISVLTETHYFKGSFDDLVHLRAKAPCPFLAKDFMIDPYQILWAKYHGADCVLLIADLLDNALLQQLYKLAISLGMDVLVELFDDTFLPNVLNLEPSMVGINSRNLSNLSVDLNHVFRVAARIPSDIVIVAESGISDHASILEFNNAGIYAFLIGHGLIMSEDVAGKINELFPEGLR